MSVVSGRRLTGFLAGLRRRIRVLCQPRSENCPGLPIFFGEARQYGVSPDGQRFLVNLAADEGAASPITLILNWKAKP